MSEKERDLLRELGNKASVQAVAANDGPIGLANAAMAGLLTVVAVDLNRTADALEKISAQHAELVTATKMGAAR